MKDLIDRVCEQQLEMIKLSEITQEDLQDESLLKRVEEAENSENAVIVCEGDERFEGFGGGLSWFKDAMDQSNRREYLGKMMNEHKLSCPECKTRQVQLVGYINIHPAQWKCRHCKHEFSWEV